MKMREGRKVKDKARYLRASLRVVVVTGCNLAML